MATLKPEYREFSLEDIEAIMAVARRHAALRNELAAALVAGDERRALDVAYRLCGVERKEKVEQAAVKDSPRDGFASGKEALLQPINVEAGHRQTPVFTFGQYVEQVFPRSSSEVEGVSKDHVRARHQAVSSSSVRPTIAADDHEGTNAGFP